MIEIRVVSRAGKPLEAPLAARFNDAGSIGRGADCTLVLPDPERRMSRRQLVVSARGGRYFVRQVGAHLGVEVDGRMLVGEADVPLTPGMVIRIGDYLLEAVAAAPPPAVAAPPPPATPVAPPAVVPAPPARRSAFGDLLTGWGPAADSPPPAPVEPLKPPKPAGPATRQVDLLVGDPTHDPPKGAARAEADAGQKLVLDALFGALGVAAPAGAGSPVDQARRVGELLRTALIGTLALLGARTIAKRELGAGATLLRTRENNPLKFSPDVDAALGHLLGAPQRGFIAPKAAVQDAFDDLQAHQVAVLAGMRAALDALLARFDPQELEQRLTPKGPLENLLPQNRKARLWERYALEHAEIMREAEGDFDRLYGRAFVQAYERQIAQLRGGEVGDPE